MTETASGEITTSCRDEQVSVTVIEAVATATGVDPIEMEPLYDTIDPDALDRLFRSSGSQSALEFEFTMAGCRVEVCGDGAVTVTPTGASEERSTERGGEPTALVSGSE